MCPGIRTLLTRTRALCGQLHTPTVCGRGAVEEAEKDIVLVSTLSGLNVVFTTFDLKAKLIRLSPLEFSLTDCLFYIRLSEQNILIISTGLDANPSQSPRKRAAMAAPVVSA